MSILYDALHLKTYIMNIYSPGRRLVVCVCSFLLCFPLLSQNLDSHKDEFLKFLSQTKVTSQTGKEFTLNERHNFLVDTEFFKTEGDKLILPFKGQVWSTIPDFVRDGADGFNQLIGSKIEEEQIFEHVIEQAANIFDFPEENIELQFLYFFNSEEELFGGSNTISIARTPEGITASLHSIEGTEIKTATKAIGNILDKYFGQKKSNVKLSELASEE